MNNCELSSILCGLESVVRQAADLLNTAYSVSSKGDVSNIVTTNDVKVQDFLISELAKLIPGSGFISEERDYYIKREYTWVIDPIDGTTNYSRGIDFCAISVALCQGGRTTVGLVYLPYKKEMFTAIIGEGAFYNGKRIHISHRPFEDSLLCTSLCAYHKENLEVCSALINDLFLQCNDVRRFGSAASELCYVAMGRCDLFFEFELYPWDYAAASLILKEAGGIIVNLKGNEADYNSSTGIIAANNAKNIKRLQEIVAKHIR